MSTELDALRDRMYDWATSHAEDLTELPGTPGEVLRRYFGDDWRVVAELEVPEWDSMNRKPNVVILTNDTFWTCSRMWWRDKSEDDWNAVEPEDREIAARSAIHNATAYAHSRADLLTVLCEVAHLQTLGAMTSCWTVAASHLIDTCPDDERASLDTALFLSRMTAPTLPLLLDAMYDSPVGL